jgi:hypothetical protein
MSREQRWAASGVVVLVGVLWGAVGASAVVDVYTGPQGDDMTGLYVFAIGALILGFSLLWLLAGLVTVRRVAAGVWPWGPVAMLSGLAAGMSALTVPATWLVETAWLSALFAFQAVALVAYAALLWVPPGRTRSEPGS